jgi:hypothetical protein
MLLLFILLIVLSFDYYKQAKEDLILNCGKHLLTVLIVYQLLLLLMKKYFVVMEVLIHFFFNFGGVSNCLKIRFIA